MDSSAQQRIFEIARELQDLANRQAQAIPVESDPQLFGVLAKLHQCQEENQVALLLSKLACRVADAERSFVMLFSAEMKLKFAAGEGITGRDLASGAPVARHLIQRSMAGAEILADEFRGRQVICAPLLATFGSNGEGPTKLGLLYVDNAGMQREINEGTLTLIDGITHHASTAVMNLKNLVGMTAAGSGDSGEDAKKLKRKVWELNQLKSNVTKLHEVGREIASTLDVDELLFKIVDYVLDISRAQRGFIMLLEDGEPTYKTGRNNRKETLGRERFNFSRSMAHKCIDEKKPQFLTCASDEGFDASRSIVAMELQSVMAIPLMQKEDVIGLIYLDSQQSNKSFTEADAELLQSLCGQAAVALVNARLYNAVTERERIQSELDLASKIQLDLLPKTYPEVAGVEVAGFMIAAKEVGGDYYDFIPHSNNDSMTLAIGDVSGKGVGAGLVMSMARCIIRAAVLQAGVPSSVVDIMKNLNTLFCQDLRKGMFMTVNIANWWSKTNTFQYTAAGHEHLLIYRAATGVVETIRAGGVATGVLKQANAMYKENNIVLAEGDQILLYTDGVTEAMNVTHDEWGLEALEECVRVNGDKTPQQLMNAVYNDLRSFVGEADQHDDITMVALKCKPQLFQGDVQSEMEGLLDFFGD